MKLKDKTGSTWSPPDAEKIKRLWREGAEDMLDLRRNYLLNLAYYMGDQWISWNDADGTVSMLEFEIADDEVNRCTVNKFKPRTNSLLARATKTPLAFEPRPEGADQDSIRRMNLQRQVLEVTAHRDGWGRVRSDEVLNTLLGGVSAVSIEPAWEFDESTVYLTDTGEEVYLPRRPKVLLTALTTTEFIIEPGSRSIRNARYWMRLTTLTPDQAQEEYDLDEPPKPDGLADPGSVMHASIRSRRTGSTSTTARVCSVYVYYERPSKRGPGCVVHAVGGKVVRTDPWPFKFKDRLNLIPFVQSPVTSATWKGETLLNDARQLQRNYNRAFTSINRHIGKADSAKILWPSNTMFSVKSDEVDGDINVLEFDSTQGGALPQWMQAPQIPRWLREHVDKLEAEMDDLFSTHAVSRGQAPGDRNSGTALAILAEKDETPLGPMAVNQQAGWQAIAEMALSTMKHLMEQVDKSKRVASAEEDGEGMTVSDVLMADDGENATEVVWTAADLPDEPVVHVPLESVMPRSTVAMQDMLIRLAGTFPTMFANLSPSQLTKVLQVPDPAAFVAATDPQRALARRENAYMLDGRQDDAVVIEEWHDHKAHIDEHNEMRATPQFAELDPLQQKYIADHIQAHGVLAMALMAPAPTAPEMAPPGAEPPIPEGVPA